MANLLLAGIIFHSNILEINLFFLDVLVNQSIQMHCDAYAWGVAAALPYSTRITDLHAQIYRYIDIYIYTYILITSAAWTMS